MAANTPPQGVDLRNNTLKPNRSFLLVKEDGNEIEHAIQVLPSRNYSSLRNEFVVLVATGVVSVEIPLFQHPQKYELGNKKVMEQEELKTKPRQTRKAEQIDRDEPPTAAGQPQGDTHYVVCFRNGKVCVYPTAESLSNSCETQSTTFADLVQQAQSKDKEAAPLRARSETIVHENITKYSKLNNYETEIDLSKASRSVEIHFKPKQHAQRPYSVQLKHSTTSAQKEKSSFDPVKQHQQIHFTQTDYVTQVKFLSDKTKSKQMCLLCGRSELVLCDFDSHKAKFPLKAENIILGNQTTNAAIRACGVCDMLGLCALGKGDGTIEVFTVFPPKPGLRKTGHKGAVRCLEFNNFTATDSGFATLISAGEDRVMKVWRCFMAGDNVDEFVCVARIDNQFTAEISCIVFHPTRPSFVTISNSSIRFWSTTTYQLLSQIIDAHADGIVGAGFVDEQLATFAYDSTLRLWCTTPFFMARDDHIKTDSLITSICVHKGAPLLGTSDGTLLTHNLDAKVEIIVARDNQHPIYVKCVAGVQIKGDEVFAVVGSEDLVAVYYNKEWEKVQLRGIKCVCAIPFETQAPTTDYAQDLFLVGGDGGQFHVIWANKKTGKVAHRTLTYESTPGKNVTCVALSGGSLIFGNSVGDIKVCNGFSIKSSQSMFNVSLHAAHQSAVRDVTIVDSEAKNLIASVSNDQELLVQKFPPQEGFFRAKHRGSINTVKAQGRFLFTSSNSDGVKVWRRCTESGVEHEMMMEIEGPCSGIALCGTKLVTCHGNDLRRWALDNLLGAVGLLQPLSGNIEQYAVSLLLLPNLELPPPEDSSPPEPVCCQFFKNIFLPKGSAAHQDEFSGVTHLMVPQLRVEGNYYSESEVEQALKYLPWLAGVFFRLVASSSAKNHALSASQRRILKFAERETKRHMQLFLDIDPALSSQQNLAVKPAPRLKDARRALARSHDALVVSLRSGHFELADKLLDLLRSIWKQRSLALVFNYNHLSQLLISYPDGLVRFLQDTHGVSELAIERCEPTLARGCERLPLVEPTVRGASGMEPARFWGKKFTHNPLFWVWWSRYLPDLEVLRAYIRRKYEPEANRVSASEMNEGYIVAVNGALQHRRQIIALAGQIQSDSVQEKIFSLQLINALIRYEVHENKAAIWFLRSLLLHLLVVGVYSWFGVVVTKEKTNFNVETLVPLGLVLILSSLLLRERFHLARYDLSSFSHIWSYVDVIRILATFAGIVAFFFSSPSRFFFISISVLFCWVKTLGYLSSFETFAFLVRTIVTVVYQLLAFIFILLILLAGFTCCFYIMFQKHSEDINWEEFESGPYFGTFWQSAFSMFTMLFGAFDSRVFLLADQSIQVSASLAFLGYMFLVSWILLTILIAVVSDVFETIQQKKKTSFRIERGAMAVAHEIKSDFRVFPRHEWILMLCPARYVQDERDFQASVKNREMGYCPEPKDQPSSSKFVPQDFGAENFALVHTELRLRVVSEVMYKVDDAGFPQLQRLKENSVQNTGRFSPKCALRPDKKELQRELRIPHDAVSFAYAFPLVGVEHILREHKHALAAADERFAFLLYGGFIFFDEDEIVSVHAFVRGGSDVQFAVAKSWPKELSAPLHLHQRFERMTRTRLSEMGVRHQTWICPGEVIDDTTSTKSKDWSHGAFVYLFHNNVIDAKNSQNDVYFALEPSCQFAQVVQTRALPDTSQT